MQKCVSVLKINTVKCSHLDLRICIAITYFNLKAYLGAAARTYLIKTSWKYDTIIRGQSKTTFRSPSNKLHAGRAEWSQVGGKVFHAKVHAANSPRRQRMGFGLSKFSAWNNFAGYALTSSWTTATLLCTQSLHPQPWKRHTREVYHQGSLGFQLSAMLRSLNLLLLGREGA